RVVGDRLRTVMSSIMRRRNGLMPSFVIAKAPVCRVGDSQPQPDRQVASLYKPSAPLSTGITLAISGLYRASGSVQSFSEGQMRSLKLGLAATAMICALSATAQAADCVRVAVAGESLTHDIAVLFSTNGLKNIIYGQGRVGQGPVRTTCKTGSSTTTCHSSQMACKVTTPKTCLGAWLCLPL